MVPFKKVSGYSHATFWRGFKDTVELFLKHISRSLSTTVTFAALAWPSVFHGDKGYPTQRPSAPERLFMLAILPGYLERLRAEFFEHRSPNGHRSSAYHSLTTTLQTDGHPASKTYLQFYVFDRVAARLLFFSALMAE